MKSEKNTEWVDVVFPHAPYGHFTYAVPPQFRTGITLGSRVLVPLGKRRTTGFVINFPVKPAYEQIKDIEDLLDTRPLLPPDLLALTQWIAEYYLTPWGEVIATALPPGLLKREKLLIAAADSGIAGSGLEKQIVQLLETHGAMYADQLKRRLKKPLSRLQLNRMAEAGILSLETVLQETQVSIQLEDHYSLASSFSESELEAIRRKAPRQAYVIDVLTGARQPVPRPDLEVPVAVLNRMETMGWIEREEEEKIRNPYDPARIRPMEPVTLTHEQNAALKSIQQAVIEKEFQTFLLHGVTASGKTQVYIEAIRHVLDQGRDALVLIPEIALTPQAVERYQGAFGDQVAVLHSRMSMGERYDAWREIQRGRYRIALGPRSAIFAPLNNLGILIVDEEHDGSYKQNDPAPRYQARDVAVMRAMMSRSCIILGSATPSLESYYNAEQKKYRLLELKQRIDDVSMPQVTILDRSGLEAWDENRIFDARLLAAVADRIEAGEQVMLLQNRRGFATFLRCSACGAIETCPHCDISLTFHQSDRWLRCHYCGHQKRAMDACPKCSGATLKYRGIGTQRVEEQLQAHLPQARILRMDQDTTRRKGGHEKLLRAFDNHEADILIGTQMIAKGHDFARVHLVGIISADTGLHFPDFRAGERTFQLLTQTAGRAGRRDRQGQVIIQTQQPDHPVLDFAREHDYNGFYAMEIEQRRELGYPPWGRLAMIRFRGRVEDEVHQAAREFHRGIPQYKGLEILGPIPSPLARLQNQFRYHIILRSQRSTDPGGHLLRTALRQGLQVHTGKKRHNTVHLAVDMDPVDLL